MATGKCPKINKKHPDCFRTFSPVLACWRPFLHFFARFCTFWAVCFWLFLAVRFRTFSHHSPNAIYRGTFNRYTKRPLQDSAIIFSTRGLGEPAFYCANHRLSCEFLQPPGWKIHRFFRWNMPFAVFRSGSAVSEFSGCHVDSPEYPKDPDILKTVRVVNLLSVVNLLRVVIHYWKCSESLHFVLIYYVLSSESLCVVNSLQSSKTLRNRTPY